MTSSRVRVWAAPAGRLLLLGMVGSLTLSLAGASASAAAAVTSVPPRSGPSGATAQADLDRHIMTLLKRRLHNPVLGSDVGIQVRGANGAGVMFSSQAREPQLPASNMKLITAISALTTLGRGAALSTDVGSLGSGRRLVLVGHGDPLLSSGDLDALARRTVAVRGTAGHVKVFISARAFNDASKAPGWGRDYVPGEVTFVRSLGRHGYHAYDTARDAGTYFVSRLRARGLHATYAGRHTGAYTRLASRSHTVGQALAAMLPDSDNQIAETLFRVVALARGYPATWAGGTAAVRAVLRGYGVPMQGLRLVDGSGLSRSNRLTAQAVSRLLAIVESGDYPALHRLVGWLPVAGRTGTLAPEDGRFTTAPSRCAAGHVHAKTGTLTGALALSGVAVGNDGERRVFSILVNHPPIGRYGAAAVRRAMDGLAATLTGCW